MSVIDRVVKNIEEHKLILPHDRILVAISGESDSVALLHVLHNALGKIGLPYAMQAITVDEGIGSYRKKSSEFAQNLARNLSIEHNIFSFKDFFGSTLDELYESTSKKHVCERWRACTYCATLRWRIIFQKAAELDSNKIVTGHNLDDTAMLPIFGIISRNVHQFNQVSPISEQIQIRKDSTPCCVVKPFYDVSKKEIMEYLHKCGLTFNKDVCPYMKYSIHGKIKGFLNALELVHPQIKREMITRNAEFLRNLTQSSPPITLSECPSCGKLFQWHFKQDLCIVCFLLKEADNLNLKPQEAHSDR